MEQMVRADGVLGKAVGILDALEERGPLALADLATATGYARATTHRVAVALEGYGLVRRDEQGRFALGLRLLGLGRAAAEGLPLSAVARPVLQRLRDETGESVQLFVRSGEGRVAAISLESPHGLRWIVPTGAVLPLDRGSAGRALTSPPSLVKAWVESVEEREPGVASVSAPVVDAAGNVLAAVSVSGPIERLTRHPGQRFGPAVAAAADEVARSAALH